MSAIRDQTRAAHLPITDPDPLRPGRAAVIRWSISPEALRAAVPGLLNGHAAGLNRAELEWRVWPEGAGRGAAEATLRLEHAAGGAEVVTLRTIGVPAHDDTPPVSWTIDAANGFEHVDAGPLLRLSLRRGGGGEARVVYARTDLLGGLGLPGGVYDGPLAGEP